MSKKIITEHFDSIHELLSTLDSRENNSVMRGKHSSDSGDYDFTRTHSYKEACDLISTGYTDILPKIKDGIRNTEQKFKSEFQLIPKNRPHNQEEGFVPHVPNSILNLPNSMININKQPQKQKTLDIVYVMGAYCGQDAQLFIDAGVCLLSAIKILELRNISVRLRVSFKFSSDYMNETDGEMLFPTVTVKNYRQRLDLQKLCFPLAHPSMFRRIGFKWLETQPKVEGNWACGYGYSIAESNQFDFDNMVKMLNLPKNTIVLKAQQIKDLKFNVTDLLKKILIMKKDA